MEERIILEHVFTTKIFYSYRVFQHKLIAFQFSLLTVIHFTLNDENYDKFEKLIRFSRNT